MGTPYPQDLPVAEGLEIVSIIRNNEIGTKKAKFGYDVWLLQGFLQKTLLGDPAVPAPLPNNGGIVITPQVIPPSFDAVGSLEKLCLAHQAGTIDAQFAIPWKTILQWALTELSSIIAGL